MYRLFLGLRYLFTRPVHLLGMLGVAVGVAALIVVVSLFSGFLRDIRVHIKSASADIGIYGLPWLTRFEAIEETLLGIENVAAVAPRLVWFGLLHVMDRQENERSDSGQNSGIEDSPRRMLIGVDPEREAAVSGFKGWLETPGPDLRVGNVLKPFEVAGSDTPGLLLSERQLRNDSIGRGALLRVTSAMVQESAQDGPLRLFDATFAISGGFATRHFAFDSGSSFTHIQALRTLLAPEATEPVVNEIVLRVKDETRGQETADRIRKILGVAHPNLHGTRVMTWENRHRLFLSAVEHQRGLLKLVLFVIMVVAGFLIFATLSMMVVEKVHDIGILTALGATRAGVAEVFVICGSAIAGLGALLGALLGVLAAYNLDGFNRWLRGTFGIDLFPPSIYNLEHVPADVDPIWVAQVTLMAIAVGILVALVPALRAARHDPLESLRQR